MENDRLLQMLVGRAEADPGVLAVVAFGSAVRGGAGPSSDLDVCLVLQPEALHASSEKRLQYLADSDLDVHIFQQLPLYIRRRVLREGRVLLSKDDDRLYALALRTAQAFEDFRHLYEGYLEAVRHDRP